MCFPKLLFNSLKGLKEAQPSDEALLQSSQSWMKIKLFGITSEHPPAESVS